MKRGQLIALLVLSTLIITSAYFTYFSLTGKAISSQTQGVTKTYIYAGTLAASKSSDNPETQYYIQDHLGSNKKVLENGQIEQSDDTYAFGETKFHEGSQENNYKFTGKPLDDETGLYYYGARYYSPELGRFIQADALRDGNRYAYASNNPLKFVDPTGNEDKKIDVSLPKQPPETVYVSDKSIFNIVQVLSYLGKLINDPTWKDTVYVSLDILDDSKEKNGKTDQSDKNVKKNVDTNTEEYVPMVFPYLDPEMVSDTPRPGYEAYGESWYPEEWFHKVGDDYLVPGGLVELEEKRHPNPPQNHLNDPSWERYITQKRRIAEANFNPTPTTQSSPPEKKSFPVSRRPLSKDELPFWEQEFKPRLPNINPIDDTHPPLPM